MPHSPPASAQESGRYTPEALTIPDDMYSAGNAPTPDPTQTPIPVAPGTTQVNMMDENNELVSIPAEHYHAAIASGDYKLPTPEDIQKYKDEEQYGGFGQQLATGVEHALSTATFGASTGLERAAGISSGENITGRSRTNKGWGFAGDVGGLLLPMGELGSAGKLIGKAGESVAAKAGLGALEHGPQLEGAAAKFIPNGGMINGMLTTGTRGAVETGLLSAGDEVSRAFAEDPTQPKTAGGVISEIGLSSLIGGGLMAPFGAAHPLWKATSESKLGQALSGIKRDADGNVSKELHPWAVKVLSTVGGVPEEDIKSYIKNRDLIHSAPEFEDLYNKVLDHVDSIHQGVADASIAADDAAKAFKDIKNQTYEDLRQKGYESGMANTMAKAQLKTAMTDLAERSQTTAINQAKPIAEATEQLRRHVVQGSQGAYDILANSGENIHLGGFLSKGEELAGELEARNTLESKAMADRLREYTKGVALNGLERPAVEVKPMIQGLDELGKWDFNASTFDKGLSRYYTELRQELDGTLKAHVPEYAEAMKPLAQDTKLLKSLKNYGSEESATKALKSIKNVDRYKNDMPMLRQLEERVGTPLTKEIEPYANPDIRKRMFKELPEYGEAEKTASIVSELKNPETKRIIDETLARSEQGNLNTTAKKALADAMEAKEGLGKVTPANLEGKLRSAMRGRFHAQNTLGGLPDFEGSSLMDALEHIKTREAFNKSAINGSRKVNAFGGIGALAGELLGHSVGGAIGGMSLGAALGLITDKYGPQTTAHILDAYIDHWGKIHDMVGIKNKEAIRYALSKTLDSTAPVSAAAFKATAEYAAHAMKGIDTVNRYSKAIFASNKDIPINDDTKKLKKSLAQVTPENQMDQGKGLNQYLPDQQASLAKTTSTAIAYLQQQKPNEERQSPLDPKPMISTTEKSQYERTLSIAEHPTNMFGYIKAGRLTGKDVTDFKALYPDMYNQMATSLQQNILDHTSKGDTIPYQSRLGLSVFLGQPMDSTMTPGSIIAAQMASSGKPSEQPQDGSKPPPSSSVKGLGKMAESYQTPGQSRAADKIKH